MNADAASPDDLPVGIPGILDQRILDQSELWSDRYGRVHRITDMPNEYLRKVIGFLERRAREFARTEFNVRSNLALDADAPEAWSRRAVLERPLDWLRSRPLMAELYMELAQRGDPLTRSDPPPRERFRTGDGQELLIHPRRTVHGPNGPSTGGCMSRYSDREKPWQPTNGVPSLSLRRTR